MELSKSWGMVWKKLDVIQLSQSKQEYLYCMPEVSPIVLVGIHLIQYDMFPQVFKDNNAM